MGKRTSEYRLVTNTHPVACVFTEHLVG